MTNSLEALSYSFCAGFKTVQSGNGKSAKNKADGQDNSLQGPAVLLEDVFNPLEQGPLPFPHLNLCVDPCQLSFIFCNPSFRGCSFRGRGVLILYDALIFRDFGFKLFQFLFQFVQEFEGVLFCSQFIRAFF